MQLRYGAPLGMAMIFGMVSLTLDKILVAGICSDAEFATCVNGADQIPFRDGNKIDGDVDGPRNGQERTDSDCHDVFFHGP